MTKKPNQFSLLSGARGRNRTTDTRIFNPSGLNKLDPTDTSTLWLRKRTHHFTTFIGCLEKSGFYPRNGVGAIPFAPVPVTANNPPGAVCPANSASLR